MATTVSIPGANGVPLIFKITGTSNGNFATEFQNQVGVGTPNIRVLSNGDTQISNNALNSPLTFAPDAPAPGSVIINEIFSTGTTAAPVYKLQFGNEHTVIDLTTTNNTVVGSAQGGDSVLGNGGSTYIATGSFNQVTFLAGDNTYDGSSVSGGDTITGGDGQDTINTGLGYSTVFSGAGGTVINLNDTVGANGDTPGGLVYLGDGLATVNATGSYDDVITGTNGQSIFGNADLSATGTLNVIIGDNATSTGAGNDLIVANSSTTNVFDSVGGNSIFGGSANLVFVGGISTAGDTVSDSIVGGSGSTFIYGSTGNDLAFAGDTSGSVATFVAGNGNETLNAANADGRVNFFGAAEASSSGSLVGSTTGFNYFQTGGGAESIVGGTGTNIFGITDGGSSSHITVFDFAAGNDSVNFLGETAAQVTADLNSGVTSTINGQSALTLTLSDNTTVTFVGITSLTGHVVGGTGT